MARAEIKTVYGSVSIEDTYGLNLIADNGEKQTCVVMTAEQAMEIGEVLRAFGTIHKPRT